jgi:hypothetical protein
MFHLRRKPKLQTMNAEPEMVPRKTSGEAKQMPPWAQVGMLQRQTEALQTGLSGCRKTIQTDCPGKKGIATIITEYPERLTGLRNLGTCALSIAGLDADEKFIWPHAILQPGESLAEFLPPPGSQKVGFACWMDCDGTGILELEYLCA